MKETDLIDALKKRDQSVISVFLQEYTPLIRYIIAPILQDKEEQEECISEVAMRVWEKNDQYDIARGNWTGWLTAIARNAALNRVRKIKPTESIDDIHKELTSSEPTPEELMLQKERQQILYQAIDELSAQDRTLFYRKYYYLQPTAQIASEFGMSERAVEGRLYRIKKRLRKILGGVQFE